MTEPSGDWMKAEFDDANWQTGSAPFADPSTAQYKPATPWSEGKAKAKT
jgi:hypothetical protein